MGEAEDTGVTETNGQCSLLMTHNNNIVTKACHTV